MACKYCGAKRSDAESKLCKRCHKTLVREADKLAAMYLSAVEKLLPHIVGDKLRGKCHPILLSLNLMLLSKQALEKYKTWGIDPLAGAFTLTDLEYTRNGWLETGVRSLYEEAREAVSYCKSNEAKAAILRECLYDLWDLQHVEKDNSLLNEAASTIQATLHTIPITANSASSGDAPATDRQRHYLRTFGVSIDESENLTKHEASTRIDSELQKEN